MLVENRTEPDGTAVKLEETVPPRVSIAVRAWNEEAVIRRTLDLLFWQSIFGELARRGQSCEVICIPNGCTDRTAEIAEAEFARYRTTHPFARAISCRVEAIAEAGRNNTWNAYVHQLSNRGAGVLFIMDSDILFNRRDTLFNMYAALLENPSAWIVGDRPIKDIALKNRRSVVDRISLATSAMTGTIEGQITGQLYGIRAGVARRLYLPRDLGATDDGFIKAVVCSDFFQSEMIPSRIVTADNASHIYEAYTSIREILRNQKRQMIGQTTVHVLVEHLKALPPEDRDDLATTLRRKEQLDADWVKRLVGERIARTRHFWRLFPDALTFRLRRWWKMRGFRRVTHFPAMAAGFMVTLVACWSAHRHLQRGDIHYWPKASREKIRRMDVGDAGAPRRAARHEGLSGSLVNFEELEL